MFSRIKSFVLRKRVKISNFFIPVWAILSLLITLITIIVIIIITVINHEEPVEKRSIKLYNSKIDQPFKQGCNDPFQYLKDPLYSKQNATLVMLTRNSELKDVIKSMKSLERHFNQWFNYPWTFLNDEEFNDEFKSTVAKYSNAKIEFGIIPKEHWEFPNSDTWEFKEGIETQGDRGVMYGPMESYHKMCRFFSGWFYKHPLILKYEWYWRVEPDVGFYCDLTYDPFYEMKMSGKKYGFTIMIKEIVETVPNLFRITKSYLKKYGVEPKSAWKLFVYSYKSQLRYNNKNRFELNYKNIKDRSSLKSRMKEVLKAETLLKKVSSEHPTSDYSLDKDLIKETVERAKSRARLPTLQGEQISDEEYNLNHFWSNFEIARVDLWNNEKYQLFYDYLEKHKGFYQERWGDAPIHTIGVAMLLELDEIHYFRDIGYKHTTIHHCPANYPEQLRYEQNPQGLSFKDEKFEKFWAKYDEPKEYGIGCRCRCPTSGEDIEDSRNDYLQDWFEMTADDYEEPRVINVNRLETQVRAKMRKNGEI